MKHLEGFKPRTLQEAISLIDLVVKENKVLSEENKFLREKIAELEAKINKNSKNSSKPPSTDIKANTKKEKNQKSGAKKGHLGYFRGFFQGKREIIPIKPEKCSRCNSLNIIPERKSQKHQVIDIPKINIDVKEYKLEMYRCKDCGKHIKAKLPNGISKSTIGPRLTALIGLFTQKSLPIRKTIEIIKDLTGEKFSSATIYNTQQRLSKALAEAHKQICEETKKEKMIGADETSWRTNGKRRWIWISTNENTTAFHITTGRSRECAKELISFSSAQGMITDRYAVYNPKGKHQYCLAHWKRDIESLKNQPGAEELYKPLSIGIKKVFKTWNLYKDKKINEKKFYRRTCYHKNKIRKKLNEYANNQQAPPKIIKFCKRHLKNFHKFWTYTKCLYLEPTNNRAERDLRSLVVRRKICYGTRSELGEKFIERLYSVIQTLIKRKINVLDYLFSAINNYWEGCLSTKIQ